MNNEIINLGHPDIYDMQLSRLFSLYPEAADYFALYSLPAAGAMTLVEAADAVPKQWLRDTGLSRDGILADICELAEKSASIEKPFLKNSEYTGVKNKEASSFEQKANGLSKAEKGLSISISGGKNKSGLPEYGSVRFVSGDVIAVCGPTGSGKTRLLEDIEYVSAGDSPSGRILRVNGKIPTEDERIALENTLCAYLSQTMNFVLDLSAGAFIRLHAETRRFSAGNSSISDLSLSDLSDLSVPSEELVKKVIGQANRLAGEAFTEDTMLTQLSGGQSRALMIADIIYISGSPVILIDEPENAGIDKEDIVSLLSSSGKIVLISTHDPLIALSCPKRIIIRNGGIDRIITRNAEELKQLEKIRHYDHELRSIREMLRNGGTL